MKTDLNLTGLIGVLDLLKSLPAEVVSSRGGPAKAALRKGALVILAAEKQNLARVLADQSDPDRRTSTGLLMDSLIVSRGKAPVSGKGERYLVRVKRRAYPRVGGKEVVTTLKTAQLLEYGRSDQPPAPWIRPAFQATAPLAISVVETELRAGVDRIVAKLSKKRK